MHSPVTRERPRQFWNRTQNFHKNNFGPPQKHRWRGAFSSENLRNENIRERTSKRRAPTGRRLLATERTPWGKKQRVFVMFLTAAANSPAIHQSPGKCFSRPRKGQRDCRICADLFAQT